jgi:hypothetical protein
MKLGFLFVNYLCINHCIGRLPCHQFLSLLRTPRCAGFFT